MEKVGQVVVVPFPLQAQGQNDGVAQVELHHAKKNGNTKINKW